MVGFLFVFSAILTLAPLSGASPTAQSPPRFQTAACPKTPEPIDALKQARCGFLLVPENRSRSSSRTIRLAVAIVRAQSKPALPDPVVFLAGGPGESAISDIPFLVHAGINRNRDLIVMNQRGTLYDDPELNCRELDQFYGRQVSMLYDAPSTGRAQAAAAAACRKRLVDKGADLSAYNTTENEQDFVDLRRALGIRQWNVYGYSYGTDLALSLMRDHPEGIRTAIIDSVVPPDIVGLTWTWGSMREGMTTIFGDCRADAKCARKYPNLMQTFTRLVVQLERRPIIRNVVPPNGGAAIKVALDGGTLVNMIVANQPKPRDMPAALTALAHGNPQTILKTRAAAAHVADVPEQAQGMTHSIICREWVPYGSPADIVRAGKREFPTFPDSVLSNAVQMPFEHELCKVWNVPTGPASQRLPVRSSIPALVVSGTIDGKTGARWGRYAATLLSNSTYVRINGIGHWVIVQSPCAERIFQSFLSRPRSPNTSCAATTPGVKFKP